MRALIIFLIVPLTVFAQEKRETVSPVSSLEQENIIFFKTSLLEKPKRDPVFAINSLKWQKPVFFKIPLKQKSIKRSVYGYVRPTLWGSYNKIGINVNVDLKRTYKTKNTRWKNEVLARYGLNHQKELGLQKTEDIIELKSSFGYRTDLSKKLYYTAKINFATQFSNGYEYPDTSNKISTIFSPAYLLLGVGTEYGANDDNLSIYGSPLTLKSTFVLDQELANSGAFGVKPAVLNEQGEIIQEGENVLSQMGILITNEYKAEILENISLSNKLMLYTDYLDDFGNIDINWEVEFNFQVNNFVVANIGSHFKYDNDIKMTSENEEGELIEEGPIAQWKQQLGIGVILEL